MRRASKLASIGLMGLAIGTLAGCSRPPLDPRTEDRLVEVATLGSAPVAARSVTGVVRARVQSDLGFRVAGKVVERLVDPGEAVRRGQPLMRIDRTDYALALDAARARSAQASADEARYRDLVAAGAVSASTYDQMRAAAETARAQMKVAEDEAHYGTLLADADGIVVETLAEPGQVVSAGQVVVRLAHAGPREAEVSLPETIRPPIGATAHATLFDGSDGDGGTARLRQLSASADPQTRTYDARFVLEGKAARAPLGSTVTLRLSDDHAGAAMEVPVAAIIDRGQGPGLWVVGRREPILSWRPVRLASVSDESAVIAAGLEPGEQFVALGAHLLHAGQRVRVAAAKVAAR
jgi:RND family efflux transporter MFP subunit